MNFRIGFGYDIHQFAEDRKLFLGGVEIPFEKGLLGHSDADVLLHAICDAMLGALALGDIGQHFPDTDPNYKNIDSKILLSKVNDLINSKMYKVNNIDSTVVLEKPKLKDHMPQIRKSIANILRINIDQVSVKATTSEKLGYVGREEGAKAYATVLLVEDLGD
ncbi:MAG: 2-C-methyl-D-erythritol 2,4-cyclodiphosphate synthase [Ignavibacteriae bacterium]|nr:2-C-methyl-D-erythritol 2,4-cyclodiphosphate synthase [Ignavibacteriota bacterium]MCB9206779.1 2-C-methyl-D-erythritol 2,4-cyclodiphosphate synthase [Ignavibacteriales bacterium]MCB9210213.1 2-C-methyl-D-erythritol 2,4-cyclodiphosphate synthase [Ignavibacteriales bacterium]MCB9259593.1 2-C-methyl-D-erythritol 2,4-cyclodiphosphate synthase [Ignavibacteriales bacterium]